MIQKKTKKGGQGRGGFNRVLVGCKNGSGKSIWVEGGGAKRK